jgi:hypothetical protein
MTGGHTRSSRENVYCKILMQVPRDPSDKVSEPIDWLTVKDQRFQQLLFAIPVRHRRDQFLCGGKCDMPSVILFD